MRRRVHKSWPALLVGVRYELRQPKHHHVPTRMWYGPGIRPGCRARMKWFMMVNFKCRKCRKKFTRLKLNKDKEPNICPKCDYKECSG